MVIKIRQIVQVIYFCYPSARGADQTGPFGLPRQVGTELMNAARRAEEVRYSGEILRQVLFCRI
jgi:hypothetical protein